MASSPTRSRLRSISRGPARARARESEIVGKDDDDLSEDLPPLDGLSGDEANESASESGEENADTNELSAFDDPLDTLDDEEDPFDDKPTEATSADADDDAAEAAGDAGPERGWLDESDEASTLDIGEADVAIGDEGSDVLDDSVDPDTDDDEAACDENEGEGDSGEEGFDDDNDENDLREEDLPALDADEDGEVDERSLYEAPESVLDMDPTLPWDNGDRRDVADKSEKGHSTLWTMDPIGSSAGDEATFECVAVHGTARFAAGSELRAVALDGAGASVALPSPVARMALGAASEKGRDLWLVTFDGAILRALVRESADSAAATMIETVGSWPATPEGAGAIDVAYAANAVWVLDANDELWTSRDAAQTWTREATRVLAMAASVDDEAGDQLRVLALDRTGALREMDIAHPGARSVVLPFATRSTLPGAASLAWGLAIRGRSKLAFAHGAGAWRSIDGAAWVRLPSSSETFAATWLADGSVLLALGEVEGEREPVRLARAEPRGLLMLVAELLPGEEIASDGEAALAIGPAMIGASDSEGEGASSAAIVVGPFGVRLLQRGAKRH